MKPIHFPESNKTLLAPKGQEETCSSLSVYNDGTYCISCWKPSFKEWLKLVFGGPVWVYVQSGRTSPPIAITVDDPWPKKKNEIV